MAEVFPRRFGKYVLLKSLAKGGMGEIYVAAMGEPGFQKFCVIKKVLAARSDRPKANRFLDEAKVVLRLAHANLVPTIDAGECEGEFYIAMELVEGKDLREIWNRCVRTRTRIPLDVALHVGREIARALSYVHSYGDLRLVHRDVAPPNILLSYFGEVKLTDFGLAHSVLKQEHTAPGIVFGRAAYLAPEQARGEIADARSDIYALGVVIWELLTGHQYVQLQNLDAATAMSLVRNPKLTAPSTKAQWITPELDNVLMRALAPEREARFQTAEEMRQALSDVIGRLSPRADAERAAEFLRALCADSAREEQAERERLLADSALLPGLGDETPTAPSLNAASPPTAPARAVQPVLTPPPREESTRVWRRPETPAEMTPSPSLDPGSSSDFTGRIIEGRYRILRVLGEGGMGTVYAGEHVEIGKGVAVKILHPQYSRQQDLVERFRREARAASRIGHPHIVDVTDFGTTEEGCAYFVMEHLDGIDLADVLSHEQRLEPERACQIAIQICKALEAAHAAGVIHRDLKPENIFLVARDGRADFVKVLDFGIARSLHHHEARSLTNPGVAMGTPEYMSPEQALGAPADRRSDIYSVGALLYEMMTGAPPHGEAEGLSPVRMQEPPRPPRELRPEVSEELERVVLRALDPDPGRRQQRMAVFEYELVRTLWGRPRAVSQLLGLREPDARAEESGGTRDRHATPVAQRTVTPQPTPSLAPAPVMMTAAPVEAARGLQPAADSGSGVVALGLPPVGLRTASTGRALRFWGTLALLAMGAVVAVAAYRQLPWVHSEAPVAAVPTVDARAERIKEAASELEVLLAARPTFAQVPAIEARLSRLRRDGATALATKLAGRAGAALEEAASRELDAGDMEGGLAHYKIAMGLDSGARGSSELSAKLRTHAQTELNAGRPAEAVRWARAAMGLAEADPDAHALLAEALFATRDDAGAVAEFGKALASRPTDAGLLRSLDRAQKRLARANAPRARVRVRAKRAAAADGEGKAAASDEARGSDDSSAPGEPASEQ
jgi:serine/threonine protein kinase